jgi:hypothetical protein
MSADGMPTGRGITRLADIPDGQRRDGGPELVTRGEHPVIAMPVLPRWRHEIGKPFQEVQPLMAFHATVRTAREKSGFKAGLRQREKPGLERG